MVEDLPLANAVQKLVSPAEMGEIFKVIALGKGISEFKKASREVTEEIERAGEEPPSSPKSTSPNTQATAQSSSTPKA